MSASVVYFDNAATSFPKPDVVWDALLNYAKGIGANPGRSGHRLSVEAARIVFKARFLIANLLGVPSPERIIFTKNATEAANFIIFGLLSEAQGGNVVATSFEHNAVARPLRYWCEKRGVQLRVVRPLPSLILDAVDGETVAVFINHASNVNGAVCPFEEVASKLRHIPIVLDTTQTLGAYPFTLSDFDNVVPFFTGHKGLMGPQGVGGFYLPEGMDFDPIMRGGTGSNSERDVQPGFLPDKFESGTLNVHGIAGLVAGVGWVMEKGVDVLRGHEMELVRCFTEGASRIKGLRLYGPSELSDRVAVISFNIEGMDPSGVAGVLDREYGIACRPGLHCAPWAHKSMGTYPVGTVRFSFGPFNTIHEVEYSLEALSSIAGGRHGG